MEKTELSEAEETVSQKGSGGSKRKDGFRGKVPAINAGSGRGERKRKLKKKTLET